MSDLERSAAHDRPRLVATDLDGTLLHTDGSVTGRTREVLTAMEDLGVVVVFVTGRPVRWMDDLWEHVGDLGLAVCSNGGIVYDVHARAVRTARTIPVEIGLETARLLREANDTYERARSAQRAEDWATYGTEMRKLGELLRRLNATRPR
jgi:HAD superfamily hydrolase (TIGR01484 family)